MNRILVAYFSHSGNTETIALEVNKRAGGRLFKIETVQTYPKAYHAVVDQAKSELQNQYRPELRATVENMEEYDTVFIGYPNWWGTMPMAVFAFLKEYDFAGKTIIPFCTHGGSAMGRSVMDIKKICLSSPVLNGLAVSCSDISGAGQSITAWLRELNLVK